MSVRRLLSPLLQQREAWPAPQECHGRLLRAPPGPGAQRLPGLGAGHAADHHGPPDTGATLPRPPLSSRTPQSHLRDPGELCNAPTWAQGFIVCWLFSCWSWAEPPRPSSPGGQDPQWDPGSRAGPRGDPRLLGRASGALRPPGCRHHVPSTCETGGSEANDLGARGFRLPRELRSRTTDTRVGTHLRRRGRGRPELRKAVAV